MLHPRDLIELYGKCRVRSITTWNAGDLAFAESPDRFHFAMVAGVSSVLIRPVTNDIEIHSGFNVLGSTMLTVHHLTHGLMVNLSWVFANAGMPGETVTLFESIARKPPTRLETIAANPIDLDRIRERLTPAVAEMFRKRRRKQR